MDCGLNQQNTLPTGIMKKISHHIIKSSILVEKNNRRQCGIEKIDEKYQSRKGTLLKYKGDKFLEDSGGVWNEDNTRSTFDSAKIEQKLNHKTLPSQEELKEAKLLKESWSGICSKNNL